MKYIAIMALALGWAVSASAGGYQDQYGVWHEDNNTGSYEFRDRNGIISGHQDADGTIRDQNGLIIGHIDHN